MGSFMTGKWKYYITVIISIAALIIADQYTKYLTLLYIKDKDAISVIPGIFDFTYVENRGSAFGLMQGRFVIFYIMTAIILLALIYTLIRTPVCKRYFGLICMQILLFSGAVGNLIDRVFRGYVVDMIYFKPIDFPVFNVADCYVTVSCILLFILITFYYKDEELAVYSLKKKTSNERT